MTLVVHRVADNNNNSRGLKPLIRKLGYKTREIYTEKGYQYQPTCLIFIV
ncbi:MAG: hypothetical protein ACMUEL_06840 [Flavobacteriales bacterium Tduv]